jgi:hypothetical protein
MRLALAVLLTATSGLMACSAEDGGDGGSGNGGSGNGGGSGSGGSAGSGSGTGGSAGNGTGGASGSGTGFCQERTAALVAGSGEPTNPATPLSETPIEGSACNAVEREFADEGGPHVADCEEIEYTTNPPCTGPHYGIVRWADYRVYDEAIPRGFWVHSLEHAAVAFLYSCTDCDDEVAAATDVLDDAGDDELCVATGSPARLTLLTPDPRLDTAWAAASWGFTLTADCFEPDVFRAFLDAHRGQRGEVGVCSPGIDPTAPP